MISRLRDRFKHNYTDPQAPRHVSHDLASPKSTNTETIKIISYNIHFARKVDRAIDLFKQDNHLHDADIICLQEMDPEGVERMAKDLRYNYVYYPAVLHPRHRKDFGNAILTKWPILNDKKIILPDVPRQRLQRIAVFATIQLPQRKILVFCVHMKVFMKPNHRSDQIDCLLKAVAKDIPYCIVAGDFNTFTEANRKAILDPFTNANFQLATEEVGWTYKRWYLLNREHYLDHIYTKGLKVIQTGKVINRTPSDHLPIWVELK